MKLNYSEAGTQGEQQLKGGVMITDGHLACKAGAGRDTSFKDLPFLFWLL